MNPGRKSEYNLSLFQAIRWGQSDYLVFLLSVLYSQPDSAARPKEKLDLSSTLVAGFSLGKYRKMEREYELFM